MIIIFKNESQFCNDNGVVSPGGSDPDNYNCGGILWPSAQAETDTARWHAASGPSANGHIFTFVPTVQDGLGLFFDYSSASFYQGMTIQAFYDKKSLLNCIIHTGMISFLVFVSTDIALMGFFSRGHIVGDCFSDIFL